MKQPLEQVEHICNRRIGVVLPSSNTVIEPLASKMLYETGVTAHFSRLGVYDVALDSGSKAQFEQQRHLEAAMLLADANVSAIVWGGTSASWLGASHDEDFCINVNTATGIPTTSCVLSMNSLLSDTAYQRLALLTPYTQDVHEQIIGNYEAAGHSCVSSANLGGSISNDFANISEHELESQIRQLARSKPDLIFIMCTNLRGARIASSLSDELGIRIVDSAAASIEAGLSLLDRQPAV